MNFIVFDLETTGLSILKDEPVEVYMGVGREEGISDELLLYTFGRAQMSEEAQRVHGITPETLKQIGKPAGQAAKEVNAFVWRHWPVCLVGHNVLSFDFPMLQNWLARYTAGKFKHPPVAGVLDTMHLAGEYFGTKKWFRLALAAEKLGLSVPGDLHDARADGRLTWEVFKVLWEGAGRRI